MNDIRLKYLRMLRCGLWNEPCGVEVDREIYQIAVEQSTTALVLKDSAVEAFQTEVMQVMWDNERLNSIIAELTGILNERGIESVLLKGQGCAARYIVPDFRNCGDIDLYVGEKKFESACALARSLADSDDSCEECYHHFHFTYKGVVVEFHSHCLDLQVEKRQAQVDSLAAEYLSGNLPTVLISGIPVRVPEANFNAVYVLTHMVHHLLYGGIGFRQLCDWTMILHSCRNELDPNTLSAILRTLKMTRTWKLFGYIAVNVLGLPREEMPLYSEVPTLTVSKVLGMIFDRGNFGRASDDTVQSNKINSLHTFLGRKSYAMALYVREYFYKRSLLPDLMPYSSLLFMLKTGFCSTFSSIRNKKI